jgi:hypothetical protein
MDAPFEEAASSSQVTWSRFLETTVITVYPGHAVPAYSLGEWFAGGRW